jgi:hypothetical protein
MCNRVDGFSEDLGPLMNTNFSLMMLFQSSKVGRGLRSAPRLSLVSVAAKGLAALPRRHFFGQSSIIPEDWIEDQPSGMLQDKRSSNRHPEWSEGSTATSMTKPAIAWILHFVQNDKPSSTAAWWFNLLVCFPSVKSLANIFS